MNKIKKILIANRGEISLRIMKTCKLMGIKTVSIYTDEERDLPHSYEADEAACLGSGSMKDTYLNHQKIIEIALKYKVDAIHPGYGFLSENPIFSEEVLKAGLIFIGPKALSMKMMGDKIGSKVSMEKLKVPLIPGYHGTNQDQKFLLEKAIEIGFPVLIKASAGGGGKGMRIVDSKKEFLDALVGAKREAKASFNNDLVLIEKYITSPKHIEVQVMSDTQGNHLHFFERECSIQRRHQKIIEECPGPSMTKELRDKMTKTAVDITSGINYEGAGTIEFILDDDGSYYFLEMNTRLQVEHTVTEYVCGVDLVKLQILVASGSTLPLKQEDITMRGHSIELRIYSEDPDNSFLPAIGRIDQINRPTSLHSRLDTGYKSKNQVTINFDPMLAKLISWGDCRESAMALSLLSLKEIGFLGIKTNRDYLARIINHSVFKSGTYNTRFIEKYHDELVGYDFQDGDDADFIGSFLLLNSDEKEKQKSLESNADVWNKLVDFRND